MTDMPKKRYPSHGKRYSAGTCLGFQREPHEVNTRTRGLCRNCYQRAKRAGGLDEVALPFTHQRDRNMARLPIGTKRVNPGNGYAEIKIGNGLGNRGRNNWEIEHKYVMEQLLGRKLAPGEEVHHKNGIRHDNRPENLELWTKSQPPGARVEDLIDWVVTHHREAVLKALKKPS